MSGVFSKPSAPAPAPAPAPIQVAAVATESPSDILARRKKAEDRTLGESTSGGDAENPTKSLLGQ
tara:strand:- start:5386 stop:5580 length:195 start_codon:yes stop_codon:yes gene_type:complete